MPLETRVNWLLKNRLEDDTKESHGWSYRTATIQIALLQEIRDELKKLNERRRIAEDQSDADSTDG